MAWSDPVIAYCERLGPGFLAEPLNALSNLAFVVAAISLLRLQAALHRSGQRIPADLRALPWLVWGVAVCSLLFHTFATRWSGSLDSLSILLFCALGVYSFLHHATDAGKLTAIAAGVGFAAASFAMSRLVAPGTLNGSAAYLPNLLTLLAVAAYLGWRRAPAFRAFATANVVFAVALILRTMDLAWCPRLPTGTHFVWHLLAGALVWIVGSELTLRRYGPRHTSANT
jgi:hypothetical protein